MAAGPSRGELWFRLGISLAGLALLAAAIAVRGWPRGGAMLEIAGIAGAFFGISAIVSARRLWRQRGR
ncbi:hypothetical protein LVO79_00555 [Roseivivax marinus]|uniref:hypothetical protein n=1 Tax=Roseivivax marinus TaxID=1379903 RepID=UPI0008B2283B|nr:hypothetical protein [Roseivivax marinus]UMA65000.1 hypothetical protein LVO79_00555 [Roseivivax marinus]SEK61932.1 hypothetical protein SAMN05444413_102365 [Roseivivax marinus]